MKIKELKTISVSAGAYTNKDARLKEFDYKCNELLKDGFTPYTPVETKLSPPSYGSDGRFNTGSYPTWTQQFVKYKEDGLQEANLLDMEHGMEILMELDGTKKIE